MVFQFRGIQSLGNQPLRKLAFLLALLLLCPTKTLHAAAAENAALSPAAITSLEEQAAVAQARDQCFLYTQLLQHLTVLEGEQLASGDDEQAASTLAHIEAVTARLHAVITANAKKLKEAEMIMERSTRRLSDMVHVASSDSRAKLQDALQHLNTVHNELLTQVFAK